MGQLRLRLLIIGGYGVFGGRLARLLADDARLTIMIAGRSKQKASAFAQTLNGAAEFLPTPFDREGDLAAQLAELAPDIIVDASGPFQNYSGDPFGIVRAAIAAKVHYLDLADGSDFVNGITQFDDAAREAGIYVLSGVSSFPVLTAAVVRELAGDGDKVGSIVGGIAPSPYAGVGLNVIKAISSYAGKPVPLTRDGQPATGVGLSETMRYTIAPPGRLPLNNTLFSLVDVPDLQLLPNAWPALRSVWMGAGPVPEILHRMLIALTWVVRLRLLPGLGFAAPLFYRAINILRWGEHRGGMFVEVVGTTKAGEAFKRSWHLLAEGNDGPFIPSMAIEALVRKHLDDVLPTSGARSAIDALELDDYRRIFESRMIYYGIRQDLPKSGDHPDALFEEILGGAWRTLPQPVRQMHLPGRALQAQGRAAVQRGRNPLAWLVGSIFGFPPSGQDVPVHVDIVTKDGTETWTRTFGGQAFKSHLKAGKGRGARLLEERFGPFTFGIALVKDNGRLNYIIRRWTFLGVPMPRFLVPGGETFESVDAEGRFTFNVEMRLPVVGLLVSYAGYLVPGDRDGAVKNTLKPDTTQNAVSG